MHPIETHMDQWLPNLSQRSGLDSTLASVHSSSLFFSLGFGKRGLLEKGSFQKSPNFLEILENLEILEFLENPQTVEKKGDADHFLEILENLEILEILEISPVKRPLS